MTIKCECGGEGVVERDGKLYECPCALLRRACLTMPPYVRKAKVLQGHLDQLLVKSVRKSFFVIADWDDMKSIIKAVMIMNMNMLIKITSDREIRDVFVGSTSRTARGDGDVAVYNNLEDLMDTPDLCIIRLNELSYKNKAAPGALEEALSYRMDREKPTWVLSNANRPFGAESHSYSDGVWDLISSLDMERVSAIHPPDSRVSAIMGASPLSPVPVRNVSASPLQPGSLRSAPKVRKKAPMPKPKPNDELKEDSESEGLLGSIYGGGITPKRGRFGRGDD